MARWGNCDYRQLQRLQQKLNRLQSEDIDAFCRACAKELAARLLAKVIKRTPVGQYEEGSGKVGGTLRRGWTAQDERQAMYTALFGGGEGATSSTGSQAAVYGEGAVRENAKGYANSLPVTKVGDTYQIEIINPVEYAPYVEFGHRTRNHEGWVPGRFMLTISEKELESQAPKILERKLMQYLGGLFND